MKQNRKKELCFESCFQGQSHFYFYTSILHPWFWLGSLIQLILQMQNNPPPQRAEQLALCLQLPEKKMVVASFQNWWFKENRKPQSGAVGSIVSLLWNRNRAVCDIKRGRIPEFWLVARLLLFQSLNSLLTYVARKMLAKVQLCTDGIGGAETRNARSTKKNIRFTK